MVMNISANGFSSIEQMASQLTSKQKKQTSQESNELSFREVLSKQQSTDNELKFSKHARERLVSRGIDLSKEQMGRLEDGTNKARQKGINESLVLVDELAFIVSVKNNTVITAVNENDDKIFTNIDGAVIS